MSRKLCRRCLLWELDRDYFQSIYRYIDALPKEQRADAEEYDRRLALCRGCDQLQNGMCAQCGCFAEVRAAKRGLGCPIGRWQAQAGEENEEQSG